MSKGRAIRPTRPAKSGHFQFFKLEKIAPIQVTQNHSISKEYKLDIEPYRATTGNQVDLGREYKQ